MECDVQIVWEPLRCGSGDRKDPPDIADDAPAETYTVWYGSEMGGGMSIARIDTTQNVEPMKIAG